MGNPHLAKTPSRTRKKNSDYEHNQFVIKDIQSIKAEVVKTLTSDVQTDKNKSQREVK